MIVNNLHVVRLPVFPSEANAPLLVDADAVLAFTVPRQRFKAIGGGNPKVPQVGCRVNHDQLSQGDSLDVVRQLPRKAPMKNAFRLFILERMDHILIITRNVNNVKCYYF